MYGNVLIQSLLSFQQTSSSDKTYHFLINTEIKITYMENP